MKKLVYGEAQDVTIDYCHASDAPVFRSRTYSLIELLQVRKSAGRQSRGKFASRFLNVSVTQFRPIRPHHLVVGRFGYISGKEHLQGALARLTSRTHIASEMKAEG